MTNALTDKTVLGQWLAAGYIDKGAFYATDEGTPQGGIISPRLATIALNGLEIAAKAGTKRSDRVNVIVYADDFVITGKSKELLEQQIKPQVAAFLKERGLKLSEEKIKITNIKDGFDFLGFNLRKYNGTLLIKPSRKSVKSFLRDVRETIKANPTARTENLIRMLNAKTRGWANYYRLAVATETFKYVDYQIYLALMQWMKRKHPRKSATWRKRKYFRSQGFRNWVFFSRIKDEEGNFQYLDLFNASSVKIKRHVKIQAKAHPFDPQFREYFKQRNRRTIGQGKANGHLSLGPAKGLRKA
jgi:RNA-directed DNA polymerase